VSEAINKIKLFETPCVVIDYQRLVQNIESIQNLADDNRIKLRPHIKTHKCLEIARLQVEKGANGITCAKTDEALVFAKDGVSSITVAYPVIDENKLTRLISTCQQLDIDLAIVVDSKYGVIKISKIAAQFEKVVKIFIKIDVGLHRCGLRKDNPEIIKIAQSIKEQTYLEFAGILSHAGHSYAAETSDEVREIADKEKSDMNDIKNMLNQVGVDVPEISVGSTPTVLATDNFNGITEIRPGNYVFMDNTPLRLGLISEDRIALKVLATVVSKNDEYYIVDAGSKVLSSDTGAHGKGSNIGFGQASPLETSDKQNDFLTICRLSEEHGFLKRDKAISLSLGQKVLISPNHSCAVTNLTDYIIAVYPDGNFLQWPITARGCSK